MLILLLYCPFSKFLAEYLKVEIDIALESKPELVCNEIPDSDVAGRKDLRDIMHK